MCVSTQVPIGMMAQVLQVLDRRMRVFAHQSEGLSASHDFSGTYQLDNMVTNCRVWGCRPLMLVVTLQNISDTRKSNLLDLPGT